MHSIRLRGPWQFEIVDPDAPGIADGGAIQSGEIRLPGDWASVLTESQEQSSCRVRFSRAFNRPTGIKPSDQVYILILGLGPVDSLEATHTINGQRLATVDVVDAANSDPTSDESCRLDITDHLQPHNQLTIEVTLDRTRTYPGEVTLQIDDE